MKARNFFPALAVLAIIFCTSCQKQSYQSVAGSPTPPPAPPPPPVSVTIPCGNRPVINARLQSIGELSIGRIALVAAAARTKIAFAGGMAPNACSGRVDIYDTVSHQWSTAELSVPERQGMATAAVGSKIFFAGGSNQDDGIVTSRVDIFDVATNSWSTAELSQARGFLSAVTAGNKIFFGGGGLWGPLPGTTQGPNAHNYFVGSDVVDVYDNAVNTWSTINLSEGRFELSATLAGGKIYFAGGLNSIYQGSNVIDIFDLATNTWTVSHLHEVKTGHASIAANNKIFWASGANTSYWYGYHLSDKVEMLDLNNNTTTTSCTVPRNAFAAVKKDNNLVFFTGNLTNTPGSGTYFDIYNLTTGEWSTGVLDQKINDAAVISVNNKIYVAGGRKDLSGQYSKQVWTLEF